MLVYCNGLYLSGLLQLFSTPWTIQSMVFSTEQSTGVGSLSLLQGIFPTQGSNPGLLHYKRILYQLSHKGSPRIQEWVGSLSLLQWIFLTQESNWGLQHCRWILYQLSYQGSRKLRYGLHNSLTGKPLIESHFRKKS